MSIFGWKKTVVIYENSTLGISLYETFIGVASAAGIRILNDEDKRIVKEGYQLSDFNRYKSLLLHAINTNGNIIILFLNMDYNSAFFMLAHFYDLGLRRGDAVFLFYEVAYFFSTIALGVDKSVIEKCSELVYGCISVWQAEWYGDFGQKVWKEWVLERNSSFYFANQCHAFDAGWLGLSAINTLIQTGEDYTDPDVLNSAIHKQKIIGCAGKLVMAQDQNEPEEMVVNINNVLYNETTSEWVDYPVGYYSLSSNPQFKFHTDIIWPNGKTQIPGDMRKDKYECPFHSRFIQNSSLGEGIYIGIILFWAFCATAISTYEYRKYWHSSPPMLIENCEISIKDIITHLCIFIEFFEMLALAPDFTWIYWRFSYIYNLFGFLSRTDSYHNHSFWPGVSAWIIICWVSFILNAFLFSKLDEKIKWHCSIALKSFSKELIPLISNLCFIPAINSIFSAFKCTKSTSSELSDVFLYADCNYKCWEGEHLLLIICSILALMVYIPSSISKNWVSCNPLASSEVKRVWCFTNYFFILHISF
ncbi:unnamed protein product [Blepharisma stoltei]|uniref:Receptor ligand binding region domain-containing protein n=1 Tax=Blepharisma stoltei TaxID=1481888 RepID=A0AAU9K4W8_9CILI|nr:unnamed protein product [Blepharisma stoltei]